MKNGSKVVIEVSGSGHGSVTIDNQALRGVCAVSTRVEVDTAPVVTLDLVLGHDVKFEGAKIVVRNAVMPAAVEEALWKHLSTRYGLANLDSASREWALRDG